MQAAKKDTDPYVPVKVALPQRVLQISAGGALSNFASCPKNGNIG